MRAATVIFLTLVGSVTGAGAFAQERSVGQPEAGAVVTVTGCLERAPGGRGFLLKSHAGTSPTSPAAAGTSGDGRAPSGSVTGKTPTGSTATEAASPTPAAGTSPEEANPASPTYNREASSSAAVSSADTAARSGVAIYLLQAGDGMRLGAHAGHTVEVRGTLAPPPEGATACCAGVQSPTAGSHKPEAKQPNGVAIGTTGEGNSLPGREFTPPASLVLAVTAVRHLAPTCRP